MNFSELSNNGEDIKGFKISDIKIGTWFTRCCYHDLCKIETQEQLIDIINDLVPDEEGEIEPWAVIDFWNTKLEALHCILGWTSNKDDIDKVNRMIEIEREMENNAENKQLTGAVTS